MDYTSRMAALLGRFRRERNGVVADTMQYRGKAYGLNYGVSLPTIRAVARAERPDSDFARFLYRQDVRELKLATFWIADPVQVTSVEFSDWGEGIANSEMAEECAFALMSRSRAATSGAEPGAIRGTNCSGMPACWLFPVFRIPISVPWSRCSGGWS